VVELTQEGRPDGSALLGVTEIAARLGVKPNTVSIWRYRHPTFPQPLTNLSMGPVWWTGDVDKWVENRGGWPT
jgi:predicted DNA-binding transcriptional regulator AlpA